MSIRERVSSQQVLAVMLALIMLVSMSGMAFVGGAGAQTGGTYDQVIGQEVNVGDELNLDDDSGVQLVGDSGDDIGPDGADVGVNPDGSIQISDSATGDAQQFTGAALTLDRVNEAGDFTTSTSDQADFLDEAVDNLAVEGDGFPAVFVELAPQSEFSQIEDATDTNTGENGSVDGSHDFIVVGTVNDLNPYVNTDLTDSGATPGPGAYTGTETIAVSVDNTDRAAGTVIADGTDYDEVFGDLVGDQETNLQNKNIDNAVVAAGILDAGNAGANTIEAIQLNDGTADGQTVHSEKITLVDADDESERYFKSISDADTTADAGDTVVVDRGTYDSLEGDDVTITTDGLTVQADSDRTDASENITDRVDSAGDVANNDNEATVVAQIGSTVANVTVDGLVVQDGKNTPNTAAVTLTGVESATLTNTIVDDGDAGDVAVAFNSNAGEVSDNAILSTDAEEFNGGTGLDLGANVDDLSEETIAGNLFVGFETQVNGNADIDLATLVNNHPLFAEDDRAQAALVTDANGNFQGENVFGSIAQADSLATDGDTISVVNGVYFENGGLTINTDDVTVSGTDGAVINEGVTLDSATAVTFENFTITAGGIEKISAGDVTISNVDLTDDNAQNVVISAADAVDIDSVDIGSTTGDAIDITADASSVDVTNVEATGVGVNIGVDVDFAADSITVDDVTLTGAFSGTAVDVADASGGDVSVTNVTADAAGGTATGVIVSGIDNTADNTYVVSENTLTNLGDGVGIDVNTDGNGATGTLGSIALSDNRLTGGASFIGVEYDLADAEDVTILNNTVVGENVQNGQASVGFKFEAITGLGQDPFAGGSGDAIPFQNNTITGHARIIEETDTTDPVISEAGYNAILDPDNNNEFGTLVVDGNFTNTYGEVGNIDDTALEGGPNSYLPGSVDQAADLVSASSEVSETTLVVTETNEIEGVDTYVDEPVVLGSADSITIQGENPSVTVATNFQIDATPDTLNNHAIVDLTIDNNNGAPAIQVLSDNAQTDFENLDVTSNGVGLDVDTTGADVNVVTVTDSTFDVSEADSDGVVLAGTSDDRDGYNLTNVTVSGSGIDNGATGLDLTGIDKPGQDNLPVNLSVTETEVDGFQKQVVLSPELASISGLDAEAVYEDTFAGTDQVNIEFTDNSFTHAVLVLEDDGTGESLADTETLYGSIDTATANAEGLDAVSVASAIVDVRGSALYEENVVLESSVADTLTLRGPESDTVATDQLRDNEAVIVGTVSFADATYTDATITGLTIVSDNVDATVQLNQDVNVDVDNTAVTSLADGSEDTDGIWVNGPTGEVDLSGVFVGNHNFTATAPTDTGVAINTGAAVTIDDSTIAGGTGDGVNTGAGAVTVTDSTIANNADDGVDAQAAANGVTISDTTVESNGLGVDATAAGAAHELLVNDGSVIDDNGITVGSVDVTLTVTDATVENYAGGNAAVQINDAATDSAITQATFNANDVSIGVEAIAGDLTVENNAFYGTGDDVAIENNDAELDATLNYFSNADNSRQGPAATDTPDVTGAATTVYDPFLTTDQTDANDVSETTAFGHDVVVSSGSVTTVGFPAQVENGLTLADVFDTELEGAVYELKDDGTFGLVQEDFEDREVEAFDAYVVQNTDSVDSSVLIEYDSDEDNTEIARTEFNEGLNFVPATRAGTVDDSLFPGGDTDYVAAPFELGDNLYGVGAQTNADFVQEPTAAGFGENFRNGAGDQIVHPHAGYLVIVNEESNDGLTVAEQLTKPATVTAGNVADRTDNTDAASTDAFFDATITGTTQPDATGQNTFDVTVDVENLGDEDDIQTVTIEEVSTSGSAAAIDLPQEENLRVDGTTTETVTFTVTLDGNQAAGDTITVEVSSEDSSDSETVVVA